MMKALTVLPFLGMLIVASCLSEESDLEGAGPMPPESGERVPPGIEDDKRSDTDKRSQDLDMKIRTLVKTILEQRNLVKTKRDSDNENEEDEIVAQEKRGDRRRNNRRENKERKGQQRRRIQDQRSVDEPQVKNMEEAKNLFMKGVETTPLVSDEQRKVTVDVHRMFREMEHGTDIWKINWDESLARLAQALADSCVFKHTNLYFTNATRVGQNLAIVKGSNHTIRKVGQLYYDEKWDYDIVNHTWVNYDIVGHYLQLVYWDTVKVGCGVKFCPTLYLPDRGEDGSIWNNAWYWACDYWPPLHANTRPYHVGEPCSECVVPAGKGIGWKCLDNACAECTVGEAGCNEAGPCNKFEPDVKGPAICGKVKKYKYCERKSMGYKFAKMYCKTTCQFCKGIPESMDNTK